jgi:hypothetical protein
VLTEFFFLHHFFFLLIGSKIEKYYKFRNGPPRNFKRLCYVFTWTTATRNYKYASTQSSLDSDCNDDHHVDLNIPPAIVDLTEGTSCPIVKPKDKSKGKRKCGVDLQSSHSSKRSTKGEEVYTRITREFDLMADTVIWHLKLSNNSPSVGDTNSARHLP